MKRTLLVVAAALIDPAGRILLGQRPENKSMPGLWEFPGGKVDEYEAPEYALIREIKEELELVVAEKDLKPAGFTSHSYPDFHLLMPLYICRKWSGKLRALEHQSVEWVEPENLKKYPMPEADIPLIEQLRLYL